MNRRQPAEAEISPSATGSTRKDVALPPDNSPGTDGYSRRHTVRDMLKTAVSKPEIDIKHMTLVEASPQIWRLFKLSWRLARARTIVMLVGNIVKSLLPAYDLSVRAELIDVTNAILRGQKSFEVRKIVRLLVLQLLSLLLKNIVEVVTNNNQIIINLRLVRVLRRRLLEAHLKLDSVALNRPDTQALLKGAVAMTEQNYLTSLIRTVFSLSNSALDITARVLTTSRTINLPALPYFLMYSVVPLLRITYSRLYRVVKSHDTATEELRKADLAMIAFDTKSRREVSLLNLQQYLVEEYSAVDEALQLAEMKRAADNGISMRLLTILSSFSSSLVLTLLAYQSARSNISLADLHLIESTTSELIYAGDRTIAIQQASSSIFSRLVDYYRALELGPALPIPLVPAPYTPQSNGMEIEFRNVSFRYSPEKSLVLDNVSFKIAAGSIAALVGYNGSGKSTLISLLARVYDPTSGAIFIDDIDIKDYDPKELSKYIAFTPQDFARWPLTGYENVAVGNITDINDENKVKMAARATGAYDTLDGTDMRSTEDSIDRKDEKLWSHRLSRLTREMQAAQAEINGSSDAGTYGRRPRQKTSRDTATELSGGQWQKVALARSFLRGGKLLILDEPSANLDPQAEYDLFSNLVADRDGRTTLFITHRLGLVQAADTILFLEKGKLIEVGSPETLMQLEHGKYRHLVEIQAEGFAKK